jgi:hypothetical protein
VKLRKVYIVGNEQSKQKGEIMGNKIIVSALFLVLILALYPVTANDYVALQGSVSGASSGNVTVEIYDAASAGNLVYNSTNNFWGQINNSRYDILLGNGTSDLFLNFGTHYFMNLIINEVDMDFNGSDRQVFQSSVGNLTLTTPISTTSTATNALGINGFNVSGANADLETNGTIVIESADTDDALNLTSGGAFISAQLKVNDLFNVSGSDGGVEVATRLNVSDAVVIKSGDIDDALNLTAGGLTVAGNIDQAFRVNNTGDVRVRSADTDDALNVSNGAAFLTAGNSGTVNIGRTGWNVDQTGALQTNSDDANAGGTISVLSREPVVFTVNNGFNITNTPTVQTNGSIELRSGNGLQAFDDVSISWGTGAGPPDFSSVWSSTNNRLEFQAPLGALGPTINFHASPVLFDDFFNITITDSTLRTNGTVYVTNTDVDDAMNISGGAIFRAASGNALLTIGNQNTGVIINQGGTIAVGNGDSTAANHVDIYAGGTNACAYITLFDENKDPHYLFVETDNTLKIGTTAPENCDSGDGTVVGGQS